MEDNTLKLTTAIYYIQSAILSINPFSVSGILILRENSMEREREKHGMHFKKDGGGTILCQLKHHNQC